MANQSRSEKNESGRKQPEGQPAGGELQSRGESPSGVVRQPSWGTSPFSFMRRFSAAMDRLFEDFGFGRGLLPSIATGGGRISPRGFGGIVWKPAIEVSMKGDQFVVKADLPGLTKDDVKVQCTDDA